MRRVAGVYRAGSVIDSAPAFGTPLRQGSDIVLTVTSGLGPGQAISDRELAKQGVHIEPLGSLRAPRC